MPAEARPGIWRFADVEYNEATDQLFVQGQAVRIERAPLKVLQVLLKNPDRIVSHDELLAQVWKRSRDTISRNAVSNAIAKLRRAIGDDQQAMIVAMPQSGYRLMAAVERTDAPLLNDFSSLFVAGRPVPNAPTWVLERSLLESEHGAVWTALSKDSGERHVFKFAFHLQGLQFLRREARIARLLREALGSRSEFVVHHETCFDSVPYYIRTEFGGTDLQHWIAQRGGWSRVSLELRLDVLARLADAVALAHGVGLLHKDIKPGNLLIEDRTGSPLEVRVIDFGSGQVVDPDVLKRFDVSMIDDFSGAARSTLLYMAPELMIGATPTLASDVYAFGVLLYQLVVGDFQRPISPTWEEDVSDPLLRDDIAYATHGDPDERSHSLREFAQRLRDLPTRHREREERDAREQRMVKAERALELSRARLPWIAAAIGIFSVGLAASLYFAVQATHERDHANEQFQRAQSINEFLTQGFLQAANPARGGDPGISVITAMRKAADRLDSDLADTPSTLADLHHVLGNNFLALQELPEAIRHFQRSEQLYNSLPRPDPDARLHVTCDLLNTQMQLQGPDVVAQRIVEVRQTLQSQSALGLPTQCQCHQLLGMFAAQQGQTDTAVDELRTVSELVALNGAATPQQKGLARANYGMALISAGKYEQGIAMVKGVLDDFEQNFGPDRFETLSARGLMAEAYRGAGQPQLARIELQKTLEGYERRMGPDSNPARQIRAELNALDAGVSEPRVTPPGAPLSVY